MSLVHVAMPKWPTNQFQPVQQSRKQVLRAYCHNLYTVLTRPDGMFDYVCNCNETSHFVKLKFGRSPFPFTEKMFVALANEVRFLDDFLFSLF